MKINLTKFASGVALGVLWMWTMVKSVSATPDFPSCESMVPPGNHAHYDAAWHAVPGYSSLIFGQDDVYSLGGGNFVQCLCPADGSDGIATNWMSTANYTPDTIAHYQTKGWVYEQDGAGWNLEETGYLALNSGYSCANDNQKEVSPTPTPSVVPTIGEQISTGSNQNQEVGGPAGSGANVSECVDPLHEQPVLLGVSRSGEKSVDLVWTAPDANVEYYVISYGIAAGEYIYGVPNTGKTTKFTVGELDLDNNKYYFSVRSQKGCVVSDPSNELSYPREVGGQVHVLANTSGSRGWVNVFSVSVLAMVGASLVYFKFVR